MRNAEGLPRFASGTVLRRLAASDLAAFQGYRHDSALGQYQGWSALSDDEAASFLAEMSTARLLQPGAWCQIGIADPSNMSLIGDIGLLLATDGRQAEIGFTLQRRSQGRGVATIAVRAAINLVFERTQARRVIGITDARNLPSIRLLERVGMHKTETLSAEFRGAPCIEHTYAVSRQTDG
jgi:[ribosomal protein S5]-alanine N-acetyltransferase